MDTQAIIDRLNAHPRISCAQLSKEYVPDGLEDSMTAVRAIVAGEGWKDRLVLVSLYADEALDDPALPLPDVLIAAAERQARRLMEGA